MFSFCHICVQCLCLFLSSWHVVLVGMFYLPQSAFVFCIVVLLCACSFLSVMFLFLCDFFLLPALILVAGVLLMVSGLAAFALMQFLGGGVLLPFLLFLLFRHRILWLMRLHCVCFACCSGCCWHRHFLQHFIQFLPVCLVGGACSLLVPVFRCVCVVFCVCCCFRFCFCSRIACNCSVLRYLGSLHLVLSVAVFPCGQPCSGPFLFLLLRPSSVQLVALVSPGHGCPALQSRVLLLTGYFPALAAVHLVMGYASDVPLVHACRHKCFLFLPGWGVWRLAVGRFPPSVVSCDAVSLLLRSMVYRVGFVFLLLLMDGVFPCRFFTGRWPFLVCLFVRPVVACRILLCCFSFFVPFFSLSSGSSQDQSIDFSWSVRLSCRRILRWVFFFFLLLAQKSSCFICFAPWPRSWRGWFLSDVLPLRLLPFLGSLGDFYFAVLSEVFSRRIFAATWFRSCQSVFSIGFIWIVLFRLLSSVRDFFFAV